MRKLQMYKNGGQIRWNLAVFICRCISFYSSTHLLIYHSMKMLVDSNGARIPRGPEFSPPAKRPVPRLDCAAFDACGGGAAPPPGRGRVPRGRQGSPGGARAVAAAWTPAPPCAARVRAELRARVERKRGLRRGGAGSRTRLRPRRGSWA